MNNIKLHCVNGIIDNDCTICDEYKNGEHFNGVVIEKNSITYYIEAPINVSYSGNFVTVIGSKGVRVSLDFRQSNYASAIELAEAIVNCGGDETSDTIKSKRPLKTIDGNSLEGSGDLSLNYKADQTDLDNHTNDTNNPHSVTQSQVGLGNVDNTSDLDKPISTATQNALNDKLNTSDFLEENIFGTLLEANVSGTYAIDFNAFADARLTMTADTIFTIDDILNNSQVMVRGIKLTGQYVPTLPGTQVNSEVYDGSALNRIIFDVNKLSNGTVEVYYTIEVI